MKNAHYFAIIEKGKVRSTLSSENIIAKKRNTYMLRTQQLVVGIFHNHTQAELAVNELRQVGFDNRHLRFAKPGKTNKIYQSLRSILGGQKISTDGIYNDLIHMGMPAEEARYYQSEFEAGHSIIAVLKSGVPLVATSIITRNGGHIAHNHFAQFTDTDQSTNKPTPTSSSILKNIGKLMQNINHYLSTNDSIDSQSATTTAANPNTDSPNTNPNDAKEPTTPPTDDIQNQETQKIAKDLINA